MTISKARLDDQVREQLSIVTIDGFAAPTEEIDGHACEATVNGIDAVGSANAFVEGYGLAAPDATAEDTGILHIDYDYGDPERFAVLVDAREVDAIKEYAKKHGYYIVSVSDIESPSEFGDSSGTVTILKHPDGWVVAS